MAALSPPGTTLSRNNFCSNPDLTGSPFTAGSFLVDPKCSAIASSMRGTVLPPKCFSCPAELQQNWILIVQLGERMLLLREKHPALSRMRVYPPSGPCRRAATAVMLVFSCCDRRRGG